MSDGIAQDTADKKADSGDLRLLLRMWPHARPDAWAFLLAIVITPFVAMTNLVQPWLLKRAIDDHIVPGVMDGIHDVAMLYMVAVVAAYILQATYTLALSWGGTRTLVRLRSHLFEYLLGRPRSFFDQRPTGMLLTRLTNDIDALGEALTAGAVTIVLDVIMIFGV
ncbi:MAG: ATP-binding cassette subfamily B multidrug efflux pump, partial [Myxococcota bacterium]